MKYFWSSCLRENQYKRKQTKDPNVAKLTHSDGKMSTSVLCRHRLGYISWLCLYGFQDVLYMSQIHVKDNNHSKSTTVFSTSDTQCTRNAHLIPPHIEGLQAIGKFVFFLKINIFIQKYFRFSSIQPFQFVSLYFHFFTQDLKGIEEF